MRRFVSLVVIGCGLVLLLPPLALAQAPRTTRVSVATGGAQANDRSEVVAITPDGRYVLFNSAASNLVPGDTNAVLDVFLHDRVTRTTSRVSLTAGGTEANGASGAGAISADGRFVAFISAASNVVSGDANNMPDAFVRDRWTETTARIGLAAGGGEPNGPTMPSAMSADGRFVVLISYADNLVAGDTNGYEDVFVHDRQTGVTTRVSLSTTGAEANAESWFAAMDPSGRYVAFSSRADTFGAGETFGVWDVFLHDTQLGTTIRVSATPTGAEPDHQSAYASFSGDARYIAFGSEASNIVAGDTNQKFDVFVFDRQTGTTTRVSLGPGSVEGNGDSYAPVISGNGRYVGFNSDASNLAPGDGSRRHDVLLVDVQTMRVVAISVATDGTPADGSSGEPWLSADGRYVAFSSSATNLVPGDTNAQEDVFVRDRGSWPCDFEGDRVSDATLFRASSGTWYQWRSSGGAYGVTWGVDGDTPVPADYDGDGTTDLGVFRAGTWFLVLSASGTFVGIPWGQAGDVPVPADYDGDGRADVAVFRPSVGTWYIVGSTTNTPVGIPWGQATDVPVPADYDGDGQADVAVFRPLAGTWYIVHSTTNAPVGVPWGQTGDVPVPADYDGDGRADPTVFRAGTWYQLRSTTGAFGFSWGQGGDTPVVGDYDGDGQADPTVFRAGTWYQLRSTTGAVGFAWGEPGDLPQ